MESSLQFLSNLPETLVVILFFVQNILITFFTLLIGNIIIKQTKNPIQPISKKEWLVCTFTNILNTAITYFGFKVWQYDIININFDTTWALLIHVVTIFFAMDLLMFLFHYVIHRTILYRIIHSLHHKAIDPKPIDLFILHPLETLGFGFLWLFLLSFYTFNIYAIVIYLIFNVVFGLIAHLGIETRLDSISKLKGLAYLGTSSFHHQHHQIGQCNYGFYTNIWDRLIGTYVKK